MILITQDLPYDEGMLVFCWHVSGQRRKTDDDPTVRKVSFYGV